MAKILVDINVILDAILNRDDDSEKLINKLIKTNHELFITSSMIPILDYFLKKYKANKNEFKKKFLSRFKVISTTGYEAINSLDFKEGEDALIALSFKRIAGDGIIISRNKNLDSFGLKLLSPQEALNDKNLLEDDEIDNISLLDLAKEYRNIIEEIDNAILNCISNARYILGPEVKKLEEQIAGYIDTKYAVGVSSGTDALVLSLRALAIKRRKKEFFDKEDLIITTPFTFTATGEAILRAGATPLFVDIDLNTFNINPGEITKAIEKYGTKVKGIIPVHLYGQPCNMDEITKIANEYDLFVVEDCAQSLGAKWKSKQTGSFGNTGCFSFFPSKPLGGFGDGGMITTNDEELYELLLMLRKHGGKDKYNVDYIGYNARLDTIQAAILLVKLKYLDNLNKKRRKIAKFYNEKLKGVDSIIPPYEDKNAYHVYHQYTVRVLSKKRDEIHKKLKEKNIQTMIYYPVPLHKMKVFLKNGMEVFGNLSNTEKAVKEVLSLPIEPLYEKEIFEKVVKVLKEEIK